MTCHCGNCEDHPDQIRFSGKPEDLDWIKEEVAPASLEELAWATLDTQTTLAFKKPKETSDLVQEAKEYAEAVMTSRRQLLTIILTTNEKNDRFVVKVHGEGAKEFYNQETGIEPQYLAHAAEDHLIPMRNLLENLGYDVQEIFI